MISFFGASITQQKNGYAKQFALSCKENVKIFGFGGMHIDDAGIIYINDVIKSKPKYCFIDFFSTAYLECSEKTIKCIDTILCKLDEINCIPIFLYFPRKDNISQRKRFYNFTKAYLRKLSVPYLDVGERLPGNLDLYLRDGIHTNEKGSKEYASIIREYFLDLSLNIKNAKFFKKKNLPEFCNIKKISVNKVFHDYLILDGESEIIGIEAIIGAHSGIIEINNSLYKNYLVNTWDEWSYYNRVHFILKNIKIIGKTIFKVTNESFDTSVCRYDLKLKKDKKLIIKNIYYIGKDLQLIERGKVSNINNFMLKLENKFSYYKKKLLYDKKNGKR